MGRKTVAAASIVVGLALALVSGLGDVIGIGAQEGTFGWKQVIGLVVGVALAAGGVGALLAARRRPADQGPA